MLRGNKRSGIQSAIVGYPSKIITNRKYLFILSIIYFVLCSVWCAICSILDRGAGEAEWLNAFTGYCQYRYAAYPMLGIIFWLEINKFLTDEVVKKSIDNINDFVRKELPLDEDEISGKNYFLPLVGLLISVLAFFFSDRHIYADSKSIAIVYLFVFSFFIGIIVIIGHFMFDDNCKCKRLYAASAAGVCGCFYYLYITQMLDYIPLLSDYRILSGRLHIVSVTIDVLLLFLIHILFSISGYVIRNMYLMFRTIYHSDLKLRFIFPIKSVSETERLFKRIREAFVMYTIAAVFAYVQIYFVAYCLNILSNTFTSILIIVGSVIPLCMLLGASYMHRRLCYDIYVQQLNYDHKNGEDICCLESRVYRCISIETVSEENISEFRFLNDLKERYYSALNVNYYSDIKYFLTALLPPVLAVIATIFS